MYAVIETGGKQYRVELGTELAVERLEATPGDTINIDRVLLVADGDNAQIGTPTVADALVTADVLRQDRGEKLIVFKYRPKARHRAKNGHRQEQTILRVADIRFSGRSAAEEAGTQEADKQKERKAAQAEADKKAAADQALAAKLATDTKAAEATDEQPASSSTAPKTATAAKPAPKAKDATPATAAKPAAKAKAKAEPASKATTKTSTKSAAKPASTPKAKADKNDTETKPKPSTRSSSTRSSTKKDE